MDAFGRLPGVFPGHPGYFKFNDPNLLPGPPFDLTFGRLLVSSDRHSLLEVDIYISLATEDDPDATHEEQGLIVVANYMVPPSHNGAQTMKPVYPSWAECTEWKTAKRTSEAEIILQFSPDHPVRRVRMADHNSGLEDPLTRSM